MITDVRTYHVAPGKLARYLQIFEELAMPVQERHGLRLIAYLVTEIGPLNRVMHLWAYEDLGDMERRRDARNADPDWARYLEAAAGMIVEQQNAVMRPSRFSPLR